jgi:hypothetical protein
MGISNSRGSPRVRLISSLAMLAVMAGGVAFYSIRKTGELFDIGVNDHVHCAIDATYPRQTRRTEMLEGLGGPFAPMLQPVLDAAGTDYAVVSAHRCNAGGRAYVHIILRKGQTLVSVTLTLRGNQEVFPRALAGQVVTISGIRLHEEIRAGYSVTAFESGAYLAYIVSALPAGQNADLASVLAPVIDRYIKS